MEPKNTEASPPVASPLPDHALRVGLAALGAKLATAGRKVVFRDRQAA